MMMKWFGGVVSVVALLAMTGCMDATREILVKKDGSGTITETTYLGANAMMMMGQMGGGANGPKLIDEAKMTQQGEAMGAKFVSAEEIKGPAGEKGVKAVWSFDDINKVKLFMGDAPQGEDAASKAYSFSFAKEDPAKLTIKTPVPDMGGGVETPEGEAPEMNKQQLGMMKQMMKGLKARLILKVDGTIGKTTAEHLNAEKNAVTLVDIDFDKMVEDEDKYIALTKIRDVKKIREEMKGFPGVKGQMAEEVVVEFE